jgi:hypothetical protein
MSNSDDAAVLYHDSAHHGIGLHMAAALLSLPQGHFHEPFVRFHS